MASKKSSKSNPKKEKKQPITLQEEVESSVNDSPTGIGVTKEELGIEHDEPLLYQLEEKDDKLNVAVLALIGVIIILIGLIISGMYWIGTQVGENENILDAIESISSQSGDTDSDEDDNSNENESESDSENKEDDNMDENSTDEPISDMGDTESSEENETEAATVEANPLTYTNEFYPNFSLNYDDSWNFNTQTRTSSYDRLLERDITLSKNGVLLNIVLTPTQDPNSCYYRFANNNILLNEYSGGIREFADDNGVIYFATFSGCNQTFNVQTNIPRDFSENFFEQSQYYENSPENIVYQARITTNVDKENRQEINAYQELLDIILNSSIQ